jgi:N4-(beta-N-acetylglucosaminyl)-L-asparaginase
MGAVGAIRNIKTPSKVAQRVLQDTDHIFLVGEGALRFAKAEGFEEENLLTEESRIAWLAWKRSLRDKNGHSNWGPGLDAPPSAVDYAYHPPHGAINCIGMNEKGDMSTVTTTTAAWRANSGPLWGFAHDRRRLAARSGCRRRRVHRPAGRKIRALPELIQL